MLSREAILSAFSGIFPLRAHKNFIFLLVGFARLSRRFTFGGILAFALLTSVVTIALLPHVFSSYDPIEVSPESIFVPPSLNHPFGTDNLGRDIFSRVVFGARTTLGFALMANAISITLSTLFGILAAFRGGWLDSLIMRVVDILLAFPGILLALIMVSFLGPGLATAMVSVGFGQTPGFVRIVRGSALNVRANLYVEAARAMGASDARILRRHILPNVRHTLIVLTTFGFGAAILIGSSLSFLGLGAQPPTPEWGSMLGQARGYVRTYWWVATLPGSVLAVVLLSINIVGDQLRDILDPRLRLG